MPVRSCRVTIRDLDGTSHTAEVTASSLFEAVAQGLAALRKNEWVEGIEERFGTVKVSVAEVRVEHEVIIADRPGAKHILEILDKLGCDLIVMGTHGHSWLKQRLFGSVTEEVVRLAHCPVMVVKAPAHKAGLPVVHATSSPGTSNAEDGHAG